MPLQLLMSISVLAMVICNCNSKAVTDNFSQLIDSDTPPDAYLSAIYKRSFSYAVVNQRLPNIVRKAIADLQSSKREISNKYGQSAELDVDNAISSLNNLKTELENNEIMRNISSEALDTKFYNDYVSQQKSETLGPARYYHVQLLLSEGYTYRRMRETFEATVYLKSFDPFEVQKQSAFLKSLTLIERIAGPILELTNSSTDADKKEFINLLKLNLWGNRCDLSHGSCSVDKEGEDLMDVDSMDAYLLTDETENIWHAISNRTESNIIDLVMDNAAYELFTDLCLADYIISRNLAEKVRFYVKVIPWFVSDTLRKDIYWVITQLTTNSNEKLVQLGEKWNGLLQNGFWAMEEDDFFTLPVGYAHMKTVKPELYKKLGDSKLVLFKGDLNYRKLFHERNWHPTTPIEDALEGFHPTKIGTLRTLKSETVCGLSSETLQKVTDIAGWKISGQYGVIQSCAKILPL